jgi:hypothetical protein
LLAEEHGEVEPVNIHEASTSYEAWMRRCTVIVEADLRLKHQQMRADLFAFFRGTFYRWAQTWPRECADLRHAPSVLGSGDVHVGSFGTWRDAEGRLAWGVDDFDECYPMPYANDVVRLATSVKIAIDSDALSIRLATGCDAILEGYRTTLARGGHPFVLAEHDRNMEKLGIQAFKSPQDFWQRLRKLPTVRHGAPAAAERVLRHSLPAPGLEHRVVRSQAGMGSLGQQRFVAVADWQGGEIAREAKALVQSALVWLEGRVTSGQSYYERIIRGAVRSWDPYQIVTGSWLLRRLSPDANPIEITDLPALRDEEALLHAMGSEVANVHLGSKRQVGRVLKHLRRQRGDWLRAAARRMAKRVEHDWKK